MILNPPIKHGCVDVTSINEDLHTVHFNVHVNGTVEDLATMEFNHLVHSQVAEAVVYLSQEGFIENPLENWLTHVAVILHNTNKQN